MDLETALERLDYIEAYVSSLEAENARFEHKIKKLELCISEDGDLFNKLQAENAKLKEGAKKHSENIIELVAKISALENEMGLLRAELASRNEALASVCKGPAKQALEKK